MPPRAKVADPAQTRACFIAFVTEQTGRDFTKLIDSWLDDKKTPGV